jgi:molecular chaperone GrpE
VPAHGTTTGLRTIDMDKRVQIPVRVVRPNEFQPQPAREDPDLRLPTRDGLEGGPAEAPRPAVEEAGHPAATAPIEAAATSAPEAPDQAREWRDHALRLQAEMANYRKRQQRLAQEQIDGERQRLLGSFLRVVDDLERALATPDVGSEGLRRGVELTHREAMNLLAKEGVERIEAEKQTFDPRWHEAVAAAGSNGDEAAPSTVIRVIEPGYRLGDRLLRPAKVIVAV